MSRGNQFSVLNPEKGAELEEGLYHLQGELDQGMCRGPELSYLGPSRK